MSSDACFALSGRWFDGQASIARPVLLELAPAPPRGLIIKLRARDTGALVLEMVTRELRWMELCKAGSSGATIDLDQHGSLEIDELAALEAAMHRCGQRRSFAKVLQRHGGALAAALLASMLLLGSLQIWGTPLLAQFLSPRVPLEWELALSQQMLQTADEQWLKPTRLPAETRTRLELEMRRLLMHLPENTHAPQWNLQWRQGTGGNAFALPGGTIVVFDQLVEEAMHTGNADAAVAGVIAHELGHAAHRHGTRLVIEHGIVTVGLGLVLGDATSIFSSGAALLSGLSYRRAHERQADCFALRLLQQAGIPAAPTADLLERLASDAEPAESRFSQVLATHPHPQERARRFRENDSSECAA